MMPVVFVAIAIAAGLLSELLRPKSERTDTLAQEMGLRPCFNRHCTTIYYSPELDHCPSCGQ